jgi:hypothetical protein
MWMGAWQNFLRRKYVRDSIIPQVQRKQGDSYFWSGSLFLILADFNYVMDRI